jgi:hypothetical protein
MYNILNCKTEELKEGDVKCKNIVVVVDSQNIAQSSVKNLVDRTNLYLKNTYNLEEVFFIFKDLGINNKLKNAPVFFFPIIPDINLTQFVGSEFKIKGCFSYSNKNESIIKLDKYNTVIIGENFSGKTSLIDTIFYMFCKKTLNKSSSAIVNNGSPGATIEFNSQNENFCRKIKCKPKENSSAIVEGKKIEFDAKEFDSMLSRKFIYIEYLRRILKTDIGTNIESYIQKIFGENVKSTADEYTVTKAQYKSIEFFYNNLPKHKQIDSEFKKFNIKEVKEPTIDPGFIRSLETFTNIVLQDLDMSFYISFQKNKPIIHNIFMNSSPLRNNVTIKDLSSFQTSVVNFILKAGIMKLWAVSVTKTIGAKFPIYIIDEDFDSLSLSDEIFVKLMQRTERWFHRIIFITNNKNLLHLIANKTSIYEVKKPKLIKEMENSNSGQGSVILPVINGKIENVKIFGNDVDEKFLVENFVAHSLYKNIIINNYTEEFKCKTCNKIYKIAILEKHIVNCK